MPAPDDAIINSIIGKGAKFRGDIQVRGLLRVDGDFTGSVQTKGKVLIGRHGRAECDIEARIVVVGGMVHGNITASEKVVLLATALVIGSIQAPRLTAEEGVLVDGQLMINSDSDSIATRHATGREQGLSIASLFGRNRRAPATPQPRPENRPAAVLSGDGQD